MDLLREVRDRCRETIAEEEQTKLFTVTEEIRKELSLAGKIRFEPVLKYREWNGSLTRDERKIALQRKKSELADQVRDLGSLRYELEQRISIIDSDIQEIWKQEQEEEKQRQEAERISKLDKRKLRKWRKLKPEEAREALGTYMETTHNYKTGQIEWEENVKAYLLFETEKIMATIKAYEQDVNKRVKTKWGGYDTKRVGHIWRIDVLIRNHPDSKVEHFEPLKKYGTKIAKVSGKNCKTLKEMKRWIEKKKAEVEKAIATLEQSS